MLDLVRSAPHTRGLARPSLKVASRCKLPQFLESRSEKMPIYATLTGVSSNKPEGKLKIGKIPLQKISYLPVKGQVAVLKPIIDKISITYIGDPNLTPVLVQNLKQETEAGVCWQMAPWKNGPVLYQATADLVTPAGGSVARLQVGPKKKGLSYPST